MKKYFYVLFVVLMALAGTYGFSGKPDSLLYLSVGFGILALTELEVQWDRKLHTNELKSLFHERQNISIPGKIAGFISTISLIAYFVYKFLA